MSAISQSAAAIAAAPRLGLWSKLRAHIAGVNSAHHRKLRFTPAMDAIAHDCALPVEVVLGITAYDPALPFFMQRGFDRPD